MASRHSFHHSHIWSDLLGPVKAAKNAAKAILHAHQMSQSRTASPQQHPLEEKPFQWPNPGQLVYVPETYEPAYAYPVIVWLHDDGDNEQKMLEWMPTVSDRNYIGLSLQAPFPEVCKETGTVGYNWSNDQAQFESLQTEVYESLCQLRKSLHVHSERIYLAGVGAGATAATRLCLSNPEWFAGIIAVDGRTPKMDRMLAKYRKMQHLRILLSGMNNEPTIHYERAELATLMHNAGAEVQQLDYPHGNPESLDVLLDIDRFIMQGI